MLMQDNIDTLFRYKMAKERDRTMPKCQYTHKNEMRLERGYIRRNQKSTTPVAQTPGAAASHPWLMFWNHMLEVPFLAKEGSDRL